MNIYNLKEKIIKQADNIYIHSYAKIIFIILVSTRWNEILPCLVEGENSLVALHVHVYCMGA